MSSPEKSSRFQENDLAILRASLFLGAFALLETSIVKAVEFFYHVDEPSGDAWKKYIQEALVFSDDTFESSCVWLEKNKIITSQQFSALMNFKNRHDVIYKNFNKLVLQDINKIANNREDINFVLERCDFEDMTDLYHRIEVWRSAVDYGLKYTGEDEDLEDVFPISVFGMMRLTALAFPDSSPKNPKQE